MTHLEQLNNAEKGRYEEKIQVISATDPYLVPVKMWCSDLDTVPDVSWGDIYNYLIYKRSAYTCEEFKAFKSLQSYVFFKCGWVKKVGWMKINDHSVILGKVQHSQRANDPLLSSWVIADKEGEVQSAHCTCVAGLSECCSHVAAVLFYIHEAGLRKETKTVTDVQAYWPAPSTKDIPFARIQDVNFSIPPAKRPKSSAPQKVIPQHTDDEMHAILERLKAVQPNTAILNVVKPFCIVEEASQQFPLELASIYNEALKNKTLPYLRKLAIEFKLEVCQVSANHLMAATIKQAGSTLWHKHRRGRVTASIFKAVCCTTLEKPSMSLIKRICYPSKVRLTTRAIHWGCTHEKDARQQYVARKKESHLNFKCNPSGFIINPEFPHFGASPDGLVECGCCGEGCIEIKCPYCLKDCSHEEMAEKKSCMDMTSPKPTLKKDHEYYFQVQAQLFVSDRYYCDFILWTEKALIIDRIERDQDHWKKYMPLANSFFRMVILPELMAKHFTGVEENSDNESDRPGPHLVRL